MSSDRELVDRVRSAADIVRTVGEYLHLRKAGRRYVGLCPFHAEKTPSFSVDEQKQLFHCFGCGAGGDVFKFLMLHEKLEFREALEMLAEKHGIEIPRRQDLQPRGLKDRLYDANAAAAEYFRSALAHKDAGRPARDYLARRGIRSGTIERLGVGYAPREWEGLKRHLLGKGFTAAELATSGLVVSKSDGSGSYDRFRERVIFPIVSTGGKIVGFGGRTIAAQNGERQEPKYMNSPETAIYSKSETLYGLYQARDAVRRERVAVLVAGYMDFASLFEAGIENVVASCGTAFTDGHARQLARFVDGVVVNYDADNAGRAAALRSLSPLVAKGLGVKVFRLPTGEDPDLYVRRAGAETYRRELEAAPAYMDYAIEEAVAGRDLGSPKEKVNALNQVLPLLAALESPVERSHYVPILADRLSLDDAVVMDQLARAAKEKKLTIAPPPPARPGGEQPLLAEAGLVRVLVEDTVARRELVPQLELEHLGETGIGPILTEIRVMSARDEEIGYAALSARFADERIVRLIGRIAMQTEPVGDLNYARSCIASLQRDHLLAECRRIQRRIEATADGSVHAELTAKKFEMSQRIRELS